MKELHPQLDLHARHLSLGAAACRSTRHEQDPRALSSRTPGQRRLCDLLSSTRRRRPASFPWRRSSTSLTSGIALETFVVKKPCKPHRRGVRGKAEENLDGQLERRSTANTSTRRCWTQIFTSSCAKRWETARCLRTMVHLRDKLYRVVYRVLPVQPAKDCHFLRGAPQDHSRDLHRRRRDCSPARPRAPGVG